MYAGGLGGYNGGGPSYQGHTGYHIWPNLSGGGGGGASDIRSSDLLSSRELVGGGGGGSGLKIDGSILLYQYLYA